MATNAAAVDQIVVVGRVSTQERTSWDQAVRQSRFTDPKDLTLHVKLSPKGCWHRKAVGGKQTACGKPLGGYASRDESYAGELCEEGCFSPHELHELARLTPTPDDVHAPDEP